MADWVFTGIELLAYAWTAFLVCMIVFILTTSHD